jgi:hypothetical protein
MRRLAMAAAAAACLAVPAAADARAADATQVDPLPECVKTVIQNGPPFVLGAVQRFIDNGELPRIMGPFLPC